MSNEPSDKTNRIRQPQPTVTLTEPEAFGCFLFPPVWCGSAPSDKMNFPPSILGEVVFDNTTSTGIRLVVLRLGRFMLAFPDDHPIYLKHDPKRPELFASLRTRLAMHVNAMLVCLYTAHRLANRVPIAPKTYCSLDDIVRGVDPASLECGMTGMGRSSDQMTAMFPLGYSPNEPVGLDSRNRWRRVTISNSVIEAAFSSYQVALSHNHGKAIELMAMHLSAVKLLEEHSYNASLFTSWSIVEHLLERRWARFIEQNRSRMVNGKLEAFINGDRKKRISSSRDFSASMQAEVLSLMDAIDFPTYKLLTGARKARNDWVHYLKPVNTLEAIRGVLLATQWLSAELGIDVDVGVSLSGV